MRKILIIFLLLLISTGLFAQNGRVKIGTITLKDSSGTLVVNGSMKVNATGWIEPKDIDTTKLGYGLKVYNGKINILPGGGLSFSGDSLVYTGQGLIKVDDSTLYIDDNGIYKVKKFLRLDSVSVSNKMFKLNPTTDNLQFGDSLEITGYIKTPKIYVSGTGPIIYFNGLGPTSSWIAQGKFGPYSLTFNVSAQANSAFEWWDRHGGYKMMSLDSVNGLEVYNNRIQQAKGVNVNSATTITLGSGNYFVLDGVTTVEGIVEDNWQSGSQIVLRANGNISLRNNASTSTGIGKLILAGLTTYAMQANDIITLVLDLDSGSWFEVSRSVNH
jgi:hypothetical protein